jgi:hypothetical protein
MQNLRVCNTAYLSHQCNHDGCSNPLPQSKLGNNNGGRRRMFCSDKCRKAAGRAFLKLYVYSPPQNGQS